MTPLARRLITIPLYALAFLLALASAPLWIPGAALLDLAARGHGVALRSAALFAFYLGCELAGLAAAAALWLARPFARWNDARWQALHFRLQDLWGATLFWGLTFFFDLRVEVEGEDESRLGEGPYLLVLRHASSGDALLASARIGLPHGIRLRYVLKRELLFDPCLDVVGSRLPHVFVDRSGADSRSEVARLQACGRGLGRRDGVLIYPEGTRFTETRRARELGRLAREGDLKQLDYASSLVSVLPPRPGGLLGLLEVAPEADVVVCVHAGFESAASLAQVWRGGLLRRRVRVRFWRIPRARIPASSAMRAQWLRELWQEVDTWVSQRGVPH
ncbi:MAG TPA: lysophospholipid acyltransferase family protein [Myxococcota bacterium]|nr:lysophospholipid acyltransferase family protein [Myxococcota bacterium]